MTGPNPVDRGKSGSKLHVLSDRSGIPITVAVSAANTPDAEALRPLVRAIPEVPTYLFGSRFVVRVAPRSVLQRAKWCDS